MIRKTKKIVIQKKIERTLRPQITCSRKAAILRHLGGQETVTPRSFVFSLQAFLDNYDGLLIIVTLIIVINRNILMNVEDIVVVPREEL